MRLCSTVAPTLRGVSDAPMTAMAFGREKCSRFLMLNDTHAHGGRPTQRHLSSLGCQRLRMVLSRGTPALEHRSMVIGELPTRYDTKSILPANSAGPINRHRAGAFTFSAKGYTAPFSSRRPPKSPDAAAYATARR